MNRRNGRWRKGVVLLMLGVFLQMACSHTMVVTPVKERDRVKLKRAVRGRTVNLETVEKKESGRVVTLEGTNLKWRPAELMETRTIPLTDVRRMTWRDRKRGFLEGFGIGLGTSLSIVAIGMFIAYSSGQSSGSGEPFPWYAYAVILSTPGLIGGLIGLAIGSKTVVKVEHNHHEKSKANAHERGSSLDARD